MSIGGGSGEGSKCENKCDERGIDGTKALSGTRSMQKKRHRRWQGREKTRGIGVRTEVGRRSCKSRGVPSVVEALSRGKKRGEKRKKN